MKLPIIIYIWKDDLRPLKYHVPPPRYTVTDYKITDCQIIIYYRTHNGNTTRQAIHKDTKSTFVVHGHTKEEILAAIDTIAANLKSKTEKLIDEALSHPTGGK
jgi:tryptophanyl-tRNA synthetase